MFRQHKFTHKVSPIDAGGFEVQISPLAYQKMMHYVDIVSKEVGWLGDCYNIGNGKFLIKDVFLMKQETNSTTTEIDPEFISEFATEMMQTEEGFDIISNLNFWGHSHANMDTAPSFQDDTQIEELRSSGSQYFLRGIANKHGKFQFTLYLYDLGVEIDDVPWTIYMEEVAGLREQIEEEIKEKVSEKPYTSPYATGRNYGNGYQNPYHQRGRSNLPVTWQQDSVDQGIYDEEAEFNETTEQEIKEFLAQFDESGDYVGPSGELPDINEVFSILEEEGYLSDNETQDSLETNPAGFGTQMINGKQK